MLEFSTIVLLKSSPCHLYCAN